MQAIVPGKHCSTLALIGIDSVRNPHKYGHCPEFVEE